MKKISEKEFKTMIVTNRSIFEHWNTPLEITEFVDCSLSFITHLSKHLIFSGKNRSGDAADFSGCESLQNATGTFHGYVSFCKSSIRKIEELNVIGSDLNGWSANFYSCKNLEIATGNYKNYVTFDDSAIHTIQNLHIQNPDNDGDYSNFSACPNLITLEGWDLSKKIYIEAAKLAAEKERRALQKFIEETQPKPLPFL
jgi:hypothetical protein